MTILDTDHISVLQRHGTRRASMLQTRLDAVPSGSISTTVITAEEQQTRGWLALIARHSDAHRQVAYYDRLIRMFDFFADWELLRFDERSADQFRRLRKEGIRVSTMDLKIASIALANEATLLSANLQDFSKVPGLDVETWLAL